MDFMSKLRKLKAERERDAAETYWTTLEPLAAGTLSDRASEATLEALDPLLDQLGKTVADLESDVAMIRELRAAETRAADEPAARQEAREAAKVGGKALSEAQALREQADELVRTSEGRRSRAGSRLHYATMAASEAHVLRRKLAERGWPMPADKAPAKEVDA